jgi:hypothetical protein
MRPELAARAAADGGVFSRASAVAAGYSEREMKTLTRRPDGAWVVVRRGVYAERTQWDFLTADARYELAVRAALLAMQSDVVASHSSAAVLHGISLRPGWRNLVHVTRPRVNGGRSEGGVKHHLSRLLADDVVEVSGVPVTSSARAAVDIGREFGFEDGVVAMDAVLRSGVPRSELDRVVAGMRCWPGVTRAREAVAAADGGAQNIGESLARLLVLELGFGRPLTQVRFARGGRVAYVDLLLGNHVFEFDGKVKYVGRERGGVADRPPEHVLWEEKSREDWLRGFGKGVSRIVWDDLFGERRAQARVRLTAAYLDSAQRYGAVA